MHIQINIFYEIIIFDYSIIKNYKIFSIFFLTNQINTAWSFVLCWMVSRYFENVCSCVQSRAFFRREMPFWCGAPFCNHIKTGMNPKVWLVKYIWFIAISKRSLQFGKKRFLKRCWAERYDIDSQWNSDFKDSENSESETHHLCKFPCLNRFFSICLANSNRFMNICFSYFYFRSKYKKMKKTVKTTELHGNGWSEGWLAAIKTNYLNIWAISIFHSKFTYKSYKNVSSLLSSIVFSSNLQILTVFK